MSLQNDITTLDGLCQGSCPCDDLDDFTHYCEMQGTPRCAKAIARTALQAIGEIITTAERALKRHEGPGV